MIYVFDAPVYRLPMESYYAQRDAFTKNMMEKLGASDEFLRSFYEQHPARRAHQEDRLRTIYGGCWNYNEIIGYIRLHFLGSQVRGEYFGVTAKRIVRTRRKVFEYQTHKLAPELDIPFNAPNDVIFDIVKQYLKRCASELPGRYIDTEILDNIGQHVDWRGLLKSAMTT